MIYGYNYPALNDVEIHLTPLGGYIFKESEISKDKALIFTRTMTTLNRTARKLLVLCNGERKVEEIIRLLCESEKNRSQGFIDGIYAFLEEAKRKNHIKISDKPVQAKFSITGSFETFYPTHLSVELTTRCNMKCKHCYRAADYSGKDWDTQSLKEVLIRFRDKGVHVIELTGGEPTIHPDFFDIVDFCAENFDLVGILTNGYLIDEEAVDRLFRHKGKIVISVSLDGPTAEKHDSFRGVRSFDRVTNAIKLLSESGIFVRAAMSVTLENFYEVENTLLLAKKLGANTFGYSPALPIGRGKNVFVKEESPEKLRKMAEMEAYVQKTYADFIQLIPESYLENIYKEQTNCGAGYKSVALDPYGKVRPCVMWSESQIIGDAIEESLEHIFSSPQVGYLSKLKPPNDDVCSGCKKRFYCRYCPVRGIYSYMEGNACNWVKVNNVETILSLRKDRKI